MVLPASPSFAITGESGGAHLGNLSQESPRASANDSAGKRRAARACLSCRSRKVRCDVVNSGLPCTNCRLDGVHCTIKKSNRGRRPAATSRGGRQSSSPPSPPIQQRSSVAAPAGMPNDYFVSLYFEDQQANNPPSGSNRQANPHNQAQCETRSSIPLPQQLSHDTTHSGSDFPSQEYLPTYIRPLPHHISSQDLSYLAQKDALHIPDQDFRDELLRTYIHVVHPFMPIIELEDFIGSIVRGDGYRPISLLLFQAVMFVSVTFVDADLLSTRGYRSRKDARKAFFRRVRVLYGLDCESDCLALLQSLLLMTYWYDSPEDEKDTWYWMGNALSMAQVLGFHRNPRLLNIGQREKQLRCRIWWSCYMRDRLLGLGLRRPARIQDHDYDVPMLALDDFDLGAPPAALVSLLGESSFMVSGADGRRVMATMCIELSRLCICIGHIVSSQYTLLGNCPAGSEYLLKVIMMPRSSKRQLEELVRCNNELDDWLQRQDDRSRYARNPPAPGETGEGLNRVIRLHQAYVRMIFLTAVSVLHRPQVFCSENTAPEDGGSSRQMSRKRVTEAAVSMAKLAFDLQMSNQLRFLAPSSISAFLSAALTHLLDIRSLDDEVRNRSIGGFYQCVQALRQLQDMYASADYSVQFLKTILKRTKISIPGLGFGPSFSGADHCLEEPSMGPQSQPGAAVPRRIDAAYLSPSSSRNQSIFDTSVVQDNPASAHLTQPLTPVQNTFDGWPGGNTGLDSNQPTSEALAESSYLSMWSGVDNLVPALFNFDAEHNLFESGDTGLGATSDWRMHF